jgi:hypothetical protein
MGASVPPEPRILTRRTDREDPPRARRRLLRVIEGALQRQRAQPLEETWRRRIATSP